MILYVFNNVIDSSCMFNSKFSKWFTNINQTVSLDLSKTE